MFKTLEKERVIIRNGKPAAVVLDIKKYEKLIELAQDKIDLTELKVIDKKRKISFRTIQDYIKEHA